MDLRLIRTGHVRVNPAGNQVKLYRYGPDSVGFNPGASFSYRRSLDRQHMKWPSSGHGLRGWRARWLETAWHCSGGAPVNGGDEVLTWI